MQLSPCEHTSEGMRVFIIVMNVVQTLVLAYIAQRAVRKNREDQRNNGSSGT
jgi:hypothetical protein